MSDYSIEIHDPRNKETNERGHGGLFFVSKLFSGLLEKNTHRFFLFQATPYCPSLAVGSFLLFGRFRLLSRPEIGVDDHQLFRR